MNYNRRDCDGNCETCPPSCPLNESCGGTYCSDSEDIYYSDEDFKRNRILESAPIC